MKYFLILLLLPFIGNAFCASLIVTDGGEGLLVRILNKDKSIWIDTGSLNKIRSNIDKIKKNNEPYPSDIFLTHLHADHASGIFELIEKNPDINIFDNCMPNINVKDGEIIRWTNDLLLAHENRTCINDKSEFIFDDIKIDVLWPTGHFKSKNHNLYSLVLKVSKNSKSILIMGDAPKEVERWLIKNKLSSLENINVLIVGHHGSDSASAKDFLKTVSPDIALVSVDQQNIRGYPSEKTIENLMNNTNEVWITGRDGDFHYDL